ncbi:MAG TPA: glycosyltransferase family 39 protein [Thermoanaerobaculia bacterium]|nr:glycosyltransferase family 39 protein [Thermoanaerobaculia bacterium]
MRFILGFGLALAGAAVCGFVGYRVACRAAGMEARASARLAGAGVAAVWMLVATFWALAPFGLFRAPVAAALWTLAGLAAWRVGDRDGVRVRLEADVAAVRGAFASLGIERWLLIAVGVLFALYLLRGLVAPPLAWDALTYHLLHAGRYVQTGGLGREAAPDAWGYYEYFPNAGEVLWAWAMLGPRSDVLLAPAGVAVALLGGLGVYAAARELEAPVRTAALAAFAFLASPIVSVFLTSAYVDTLVASLFALGCVFLLRGLRMPSGGDVALALAAFGVGVGAKVSMLPLAGLAAALLAVAVLARRPRISVALGFLPGLVGACHYVRAGLETGNPLYPASLQIFGHRFAGNPQLEWVLGPGRFAGDAPRTAWALGTEMFFGHGVSTSNHLNFGPGGLLLLAGAAGGAAVLLRRRGARAGVLFLLAAIAINVALLMAPGAAALRQIWWWVSGRHLGPALVAVALLAAGVPGRAGRGLLALSIAGSLAVALPWGFGPLGWEQVLAGGVTVGVAAIVAWGTLRLRQPWLAAAVGIAILAAGLRELRAWTRYETYEAALQSETYDLHELSGFGAAHTLWRRLDDGRPRTIATTAGFVRNGHNWLRYPLLGSSLQNRLVYVPVTRDGSVIDYRDGKAAAVADRAAWLARLDALDVDAVVVMAPVTCPEHAWIAADRARFVILPARGGADLRDGYVAWIRRRL